MIPAGSMLSVAEIEGENREGKGREGGRESVVQLHSFHIKSDSDSPLIWQQNSA